MLIRFIEMVCIFFILMGKYFIYFIYVILFWNKITTDSGGIYDQTIFRGYV